MLHASRRTLLTLAAFVALVLLASQAPATAQADSIIVVNSKESTVSGTDGLCTLPEAIVAAAGDTASGSVAGECVAGSGTDTILFADLAGSPDVYPVAPAGAEFAYVIPESLNIQGNGADETIIDAQGSPALEVFNIQLGAQVAIDGVTIRNAVGRAVHLESGDLSITESSLVNNATAIYVDINANTVTVNYNHFANNTTAINNQSAVSVNATNNWWGCDGLPGTTGCDPVSGTVVSTPRVDLQLRLPTNFIYTGTAFDLTADVSANVNGQTIPTGAFEGMQVTLADGEDESTSATISNGTAVASFTAASTPGFYTGEATLDNGTQTRTYYVSAIPTGGFVRVTKVTDPAGSTTPFTFTTTLPDAPSFSLSDTQTREVTDLPNDVYYISERKEDLPDGWDVDASCNTDAAVFNADENEITLNYQIGDQITCTFTNTAQIGTIIITKSTSIESEQVFSFGSDDLEDFTLTGGNDTTFSDLLPEATYTISETAVDGWTLTSIDCTSSLGTSSTTPDTGTRTVDIDLAPGDTVGCTFNNEAQTGSITIVKDTGSFSDTTKFEFNTTNLLTDTFDLGSGESQEFPNLQPGGIYRIEENLSGNPDWSIDDISCESTLETSIIGTPGNAAVIELGVGDDVTCTFTNKVDPASITIVKDTGSFSDTTQFGFSATNLTPTTFDLVADGQQEFTELNPGSYSISEDDEPGWTLDRIECSSTSGDSSFTTTLPTADITLEAGDDVTCTFYNELQLATITIEKDSGDFADGTSFPFVTTGLTPNSFDLTSGNSQEFPNLQPGSYRVDENLPNDSDWALDSISCTSDPDLETSTFITDETGVDISLGAGDDVTCTFNNKPKPAKITIIKDADVDSTTPFTFTTTNLTPSTFQLIDDGQLANNQREFTNLNPGNYSIEENVPDNWTLDRIECSSTTGDSDFTTGASETTIALEAGDDVTCTFYNLIDRSSIRVTKQADPNDGTEFTFNTTGIPTNTFTLTHGNSQVFEGLLAGSYSVNEQEIDNWLLTDVTCTSSLGRDITTTATGFDIDLRTGEDVECVFNNLEVGQIVINKVANPAEIDQRFDFSVTGTAEGYEGETFELANNDSKTLKLLPATYTITESVAANWTLTELQCGTSGTSTISTNKTAGTATISIKAGDIVTCTYTNTADPGNITIKKVTDPVGGTGYQFSGDLGNFTLDHDSEQTFSELTAGSYTVTEALPDRVVLSVTCDGGDFTPNAEGNGGTIDLVPGGDVTCTFTNSEPGTLEVTKDIVWRDLPPDDRTFEICITGPSYPTIPDCKNAGDDETVVWNTLFPGEYTISETDPGPDWRVEISTSTVDVQRGQTSRVTITNTYIALGILEVTKQVNWGNSPPDDRTFEICVTGPSHPTPDCKNVMAGATAIWTGLEPGDYTISETDPGPDWQVDISTSPIRVIQDQTSRATVTNTYTSIYIYRTYVPLLLKGEPDLAITNFSLTPDQTSFESGDPVVVNVTVKNIGTAATDSGFWVDLFINPTTAPSHENMPTTWDQNCGAIVPCFGVSWEIDRRVQPGEEIVLTTVPGSPFYKPNYSYWPGWFARGTSDLYVYADNWNLNNVPGAVDEMNETNNRADIHGLLVTGPNPPFLATPASAIPPRPAPTPLDAE